MYKIVYMKTLVTTLLRSSTNIACQVGWLSAWLVVNMFLRIDGCQEHYTGTMKQEGTAELKQHPTKTLPCKLYYKWSGSPTARQQTQPAQPSQPNPDSPTHPHSTQPASHPNMTNCHKFYGFPQGLGITEKMSTRFALQGLPAITPSRLRGAHSP